MSPLRLIFLSMLSIAAGAAGAAEKGDTGLVVGMLVGYASVDSRFIVDEEDSSVGFTVGWRFNPNFRVEVGYSDLGSYQTTCGGDFCPAIVFPKLSLDTLEAGVVGRMPVGHSGFFGQGRLGVHRLDNDFETSTNAYFGLGAGYQVNSTLDVTLQIDRYQADLDVTRIGVAAGFTF